MRRSVVRNPNAVHRIVRSRCRTFERTEEGMIRASGPGSGRAGLLARRSGCRRTRRRRGLICATWHTALRRSRRSSPLRELGPLPLPPPPGRGGVPLAPFEPPPPDPCDPAAYCFLHFGQCIRAACGISCRKYTCARCGQTHTHANTCQVAAAHRSHAAQHCGRYFGRHPANTEEHH